MHGRTLRDAVGYPLTAAEEQIPKPPLGANSGRKQMQQHRDYSISLSRCRIGISARLIAIESELLCPREPHIHGRHTHVAA